ncbi:ATP-dependent RNA helicase [Venturia nashicola]|uniref:ATP-dependent RNA helicase n=1 Tax=Venturia nashicola TaxID=86259 RepID=A0A4Z1PGI1_9PEZI|nr:ATP-dependent RNA helicase [Venturia nashicola]
MAGGPHDTVSAYHNTELDRLDGESKMRELREQFEALKALRNSRGQSNRGQQLMAASQVGATQESQVGRRSLPAMLDSDVDWNVRARLVREEIERLSRNATARMTSPPKSMATSNFIPTSSSRCSSLCSQYTEPPPYSSLDTGTKAEMASSSNLSPLSPIQQLQQLESQYPEQILCPACVEFHPIHGRIARFCRSLLNVLPLISSRRMSCSAFKCALYCGGGIKVHLMTLHLVMRSHRLGPGFGLPVSALFLSNSCTVDRHFYKAILTSQSAARIVDNRLILRITTRFRVTQPCIDQPFSSGKLTSYGCTEFVKSAICPHAFLEDFGIGKILKNFVDSQNTISSLQEKVLSIQSCQHCSSQYEVLDRRTKKGEESTIEGRDRVFQIDRYIDFGECLAEDTSEWNALATAGTGLDYTRTTSPVYLWRRA